MTAKYLWLLLTIILVNSQPKLCDNIKCPSGAKCVDGLCRVVFDPLNLISLYSIPVKCGAKTCKLNETCKNELCVQVGSVRARNNPPKSTEAGVVDRGIPRYGMYYCNENVYNLCLVYDLVKNSTSEGFAIYMRGANGSTPIRHQLLGVNAANDYRLDWNYHVIFIERTGNVSRVYDFDSRLQWGVGFEQAWNRAFKQRPNESAIRYRVIPYKNYLEYFSSSRGGYKNNLPGGKFTYKWTPPTSDAIEFNKKGQRGGINKFFNFDFVDKNYGIVLSAQQFYNKFTSSS